MALTPLPHTANMRHVNDIGFSLTGRVRKRERARIEATVTEFIQQNYDSIRAQFSGSVPSIRLCINRATNVISIVPATKTDTEYLSNSGVVNNSKRTRRLRRTTSTAPDLVTQTSSTTFADSSREKVAKTDTTVTTAPSDADDNAKARSNVKQGQDQADQNKIADESIDGAIEYLMARDRLGASAGVNTDSKTVKQRLFRSAIPSLCADNNASTQSFAPLEKLELMQSESRKLSNIPLNFTKVPGEDGNDCPLVGDGYDCEARGAEFRQQFPSLRGDFFVFYDHGESHCRKVLLAMGFTEKQPTEDKDILRNCDQMSILWCNGAMSVSKRKSGLGYHIVNRVRFRGLITNKCSLVRTLAEFELSHPSLVPFGLEASNFLPATIHLNGAGAIDVLHKIRRGGLYLIKPGYSDCGKGIVLYRSDGTLSNLINSLSTNYPGYSHKDLVLQKYIENPLLIDSKKFDLRVYLLVVPNQRRDIGVYAFVHPGYVRVACRAYDINSDDLTLHLTNQAVQHKDKTYKTVKEDTVWSPDSLNSYLNQHLKDLKVPCIDWVRRLLYPRIRAILGHVISIVSSSLCDEPFSYELFGCDFLVDSNFNVWLLEVNSDPSLNKSTQVLRQIVTQAVEEAVALSTEVIQRAARGLPVKNLVTLQDFRKIFSHSNDSVLRCIFAESNIIRPNYNFAR